MHRRARPSLLAVPVELGWCIIPPLDPAAPARTLSDSGDERTYRQRPAYRDSKQRASVHNPLQCSSPPAVSLTSRTHIQLLSPVYCIFLEPGLSARVTTSSYHAQGMPALRSELWKLAGWVQFATHKRNFDNRYPWRLSPCYHCITPAAPSLQGHRNGRHA